MADGATKCHAEWQHLQRIPAEFRDATLPGVLSEGQHSKAKSQLYNPLS
jgi:hypothetical protein